MVLSAGFVTTAGTTPLDARQMDVVRLMRQAAGNTRTGVVFTPRTDGALWTTNSNMTITIPDRIAFAVARGTADGAVPIYNNGAETVALDPAPSANSRYDVPYVRQNDTEKGDANSRPVFGIAKGIAAASPTIPAVPAGALALGNILIPANVTGTNASGVVSTPTAGFTSFGGPIRYRSSAALLADTANLPNGTLQVLDVDGISTQLWASISGGRSQRLDADTFVVIDGSSTMGSNTTLSTLGGTISRYSSSDTSVFPVRSDGVIGPLPVGGWYEVKANVSWTSTSNGERYVSITANDTEGAVPIASRIPGSGASPTNTTGDISVNAGDFLKVKAWQTSNSTLTYNFRFSARLKRANN